jgi:hypothetical protein
MLQEGDSVRYEAFVSVDSGITTKVPVWNMNCVSTSMAKREWVNAVVVNIWNKEKLAMVCGAYGVTYWPLPGHPIYVESQWTYSGYLQKANGDIVSYGMSGGGRKCVCGAHATRNPNLHAHWCDLA